PPAIFGKQRLDFGDQRKNFAPRIADQVDEPSRFRKESLRENARPAGVAAGSLPCVARLGHAFALRNMTVGGKRANVAVPGCTQIVWLLEQPGGAAPRKFGRAQYDMMGELVRPVCVVKSSVANARNNVVGRATNGNFQMCKANGVLRGPWVVEGIKWP